MDALANPLNPPVLNLMSSITHLDLMRALIHRQTRILGSPYHLNFTGVNLRRLNDKTEISFL
jgi:hypothetical protein